MKDSPRLRLSLPERERRSQANRTAETRARILAAVVSSIAEVGLARTTASEVTRRAGVTWGAVQHHFGGKDGLFVAVLEDSFNRFAARLSDIPVADTPLAERASLFLERAFQHFSSTEYHSTFEILLYYLRREDLHGERSWREEMFRAWDGAWRRLFGDAPIPRRRHWVLQHYTISTLSGLASTLLLEGGEARLREAELDLLEQTLVRELSGG